MANVDISDHKGTLKPFPSERVVTENNKSKEKMLKYAELSSRNKSPSLHILTFYQYG